MWKLNETGPIMWLVFFAHCGHSCAADTLHGYKKILPIITGRIACDGALTQALTLLGFINHHKAAAAVPPKPE